MQRVKDQRTPAGSRRPYHVMWVMAIGSLGGAYLLYYVALTGGLWGTTNRGIFVDPPVTINDLDLRRGAASGWEAFDTQGTWWLWLVSHADCDAGCNATLADLKATRSLLTRDQTRVQRAIVSLRAGTGEVQRGDLIKLWGEGASRLHPGVYIVDPNGNLVVRYPPGDDPGGVLQDLKKLLRVSQIG